MVDVLARLDGRWDGVVVAAECEGGRGEQEREGLHVHSFAIQLGRDGRTTLTGL